MSRPHTRAIRRRLALASYQLSLKLAPEVREGIEQIVALELGIQLGDALANEHAQQVADRAARQ